MGYRSRIDSPNDYFGRTEALTNVFFGCISSVSVVGYAAVVLREPLYSFRFKVFAVALVADAAMRLYIFIVHGCLMGFLLCDELHFVIRRLFPGQGTIRRWLFRIKKADLDPEGEYR